jgi:hypothetical protein
MWWFLLSFPLGFGVPETIALIRNRDNDTLSAAIWRLEAFVPGQSPWQWNAFHALFTGCFTLVVLWLIGHFGWGLWR